MEARNADFVLFTGDLVGTGSTTTLTDWKNLTSSFGNSRYMMPGNHDLPGRSATNANWQSIFDWLPDSQSVDDITITAIGDTVTGIDQMDYSPILRRIFVSSPSLRTAMPSQGSSGRIQDTKSLAASRRRWIGSKESRRSQYSISTTNQLDPRPRMGYLQSFNICNH